MKIFALQTDCEKLTKGFVGPNETIQCSVRYHGIIFFMKFLQSIVWTVVLVALLIGTWQFGLPGNVEEIAAGVALFLWIVFIAFPLLTGYIDWKFDLLILTDEKLVVVNQSSIFRQQIQYLNLENIASVNVETQFWNIFPFGRIRVELKEGDGEKVLLSYIPRAGEISAMISGALVQHERRGGAKSL